MNKYPSNFNMTEIKMTIEYEFNKFGKVLIKWTDKAGRKISLLDFCDIPEDIRVGVSFFLFLVIFTVVTDSD